MGFRQTVSKYVSIWHQEQISKENKKAEKENAKRDKREEAENAAKAKFEALSEQDVAMHVMTEVMINDKDFSSLKSIPLLKQWVDTHPEVKQKIEEEKKKAEKKKQQAKAKEIAESKNQSSSQ